MQQVFGFVLFLGLIGLAAWAFIEAVQAEPALVGSVATAAFGAVGVVWQQQRAEKERLRDAHRERMSPTYDELLRLVASQFKAGDGASRTKASEKKMEEFMRDLKGRQLLLGASDEMIRAFNDWQATTSAAQKTGNDLEAIAAWEALLLAIRKDMGHRDSDLEPWDLLRLSITDLDEHLSAA